VQAGGNALGHEMMVRRMELDGVAAKALGIEGLQLRRIFVGLPREVEHRGRAPVPSESSERLRFGLPAIRRNGVLQRPIAGIEVDVHEGR